MQLIHDHMHDVPGTLTRVALSVDRLTLAKRRWRGVAGDGAEFGFDLEYPLADADVFHTTDTAAYVIAQQAERVLEVSLANEPAAAARLGWMIGNLHFQVEVEGAVIRVADDAALRQLFEREHVHFHEREAVFRPLGGGHSHGHHHHEH